MTGTEKEVVISENNLCKIRGVRWQVGETEKKMLSFVKTTSERRWTKKKKRA